MRFATLPNGHPDGQLYLVSRDHSRAVAAKACGTLQALLDDWDALASSLQPEYDALNNGSVEGEIAFDAANALAPLPRSWQWLDGSTFASHGELMEQAIGFSADRPDGKPLIYQGVSDFFYAPTADAVFPSQEDDIDFEGELGVICDHIPMGSDAATCRDHIRLLVQINDWSLRRFGAAEMKSGFGVIQTKPHCTMAPVAITPDEIGDCWHDARIDLTLTVKLNGHIFGQARGNAMSVGFDELAAHAAYSRPLVGGTVIGSGTVSNSNYREVGSSCLAEKRLIETIDHGAPQTPFLDYGDEVYMEVFDDEGAPVFGAMKQVIARS